MTPNDVLYWEMYGRSPVGAMFRRHGRRWEVLAVNRERRISEITDGNGLRIEFRSRQEWQAWAQGGWRYA